ncbi:MAG: hypothetical protein JNL80_10415 [Phycisphaerae bacterium]|jgi:hypothetical protein|nr:hypothetical protein [Phycisphaerae bacterium]
MPSCALRRDITLLASSQQRTMSASNTLAKGAARAAFAVLAIASSMFAAPPSNCCDDWAGKGCDDAACSAQVCADDPYCCDTEWDFLCAERAHDLCGPLCERGGGGGITCCPGGDMDCDGDVDCSDLSPFLVAYNAGDPCADINGDGSPDFIDYLDMLALTGGGPDSDSDNVADECDNCPEQFNANQLDTDGDGIGDACDPDPCPTDSDGDGVDDCFDGCPQDPLKAGPGQCGCGVPDIDSDGDTIADCKDGCPNDPLKTGASVCGCGVEEDAYWSALGANGVDTFVNDLETYNDGTGEALYATGLFTLAAGTQVDRIARWNGTTWSPLTGPSGFGLSGIPNGGGADMVVFDDGNGPALFVGGAFTTAGGVAAMNIAKWDGSTWSEVGGGLNAAVSSLAVYDDGLGGGPALYAAGDFSMAGSVPVTDIARWNGVSWSSVGPAFGGGYIAALAVFDDGLGGGPALYAGGSFFNIGSTVVRNIARWNGTSWSALNSGLDDGAVTCMTATNGGSTLGPSLFVGGFFYRIDGVTARRLARWDGTSWSGVGSGMNSSVSSLQIWDDGGPEGPVLYAGGYFSTAGGNYGSKIARWNGSTWSALGGGGSNGEVFAMAVYDDGSGTGPALFAGGFFSVFFSTNGTTQTLNVAKWTTPTCPNTEEPDTDGDGVPDGEDGCPTDPLKTAPGACGCGVPDTDSDGDGTPDCNETASCLTVVETSALCGLSRSGLTGNYTFTFDVTNNSGIAAQYVFFSAREITPSIITLPQPLGDGETTSVSVEVTNVVGESLCFTMALADSQFQQCCALDLCIDMPECTCMQLPASTVTCVDGPSAAYTFTFQVTNLTSDIVRHLFLPIPPGSSMTIVPNHFLLPPLHQFATSAPLTVTITLPSEPTTSDLCFLMSMHTASLAECCAEELCIKLPGCESGSTGEPADLNGDGTVGGADLAILLGAWGSADPNADLNADGVVNGADLALLLGAWQP